MTSTAQHYADALRPLTTVVDAVLPEGWAAPSPCEGWTARDVLRHAVETEREVLQLHGVDLGARSDLDPRSTGAEPDLVEQGANSFGDALHMEGICRPAVDVPAEADATRVLARLGRRARHGRGCACRDRRGRPDAR